MYYLWSLEPVYYRPVHNTYSCIQQSRFLPRYYGCFPFNQNFPKLWNRSKLYWIFPEKFPEILETVEFLKCKPFNQKFYKLREQIIKWKKTYRKKFLKIWKYLARLSSLWKFGKCCSICYWKLLEIQTRRFG